jgi:hypothetical protein
VNSLTESTRFLGRLAGGPIVLSLPSLLALQGLPTEESSLLLTTYLTLPAAASRRQSGES